VNQKNNQEEKSVITTSMIIALLIGLVLGFFAGAWWAKRSASAGLTAIDTPIGEMASSTDLVMTDETPNPASASGDVSSLPAAVSSAVTTPSKVSVALDKVAMPDPTLATLDNQPAGSVAMVKSVTVAKNSWVAVRDSLDGAIGNILGARMVSTGASTNVAVNLLRPMVKGNNYFLVVFEDNGDGVFDYKQDQMLQQNNQIRVVPFSAI
jgi:hypothetical protein